MLSIAKINGADGKNGRYYTNAVASGAEDYYAGKGEAKGQWIGSGTGSFALDGEVDAEQFHHMLNAIDPATGKPIRVAPRDPETGELQAGVVRGFDLTFSASKSVSVVYAAAEEPIARAVRDAHDHAIREALRWLEGHACVVRRGHGGVIEQRGAGFVGAAFRHRTSRAGDPQLHTHVVISNMAQGKDGRWTALRGKYLYDHARTAGFVYQAVLRSELTQRLGVRWRESPTPGVYEIAGVPFELMRHLSKRHIDIEDAMAEVGFAGPAAARVAAVMTRPPKDHQLDQAPNLHDAWRAITAEHGFGHEALQSVIGPSRSATLDETAAAAGAQRMLGPDGLTRSNATFTGQEVLRAWAQAAADGATVEQLEQLTARLIAEPDVIALPDAGTLGERGGAAEAAASLPAVAHGVREGEGQGGRDAGVSFRPSRFTTREHLAVERDLLARARAGAAAGAGVCAPGTVKQVLATAATASADQSAMVRALTSRGDRLQVVRAPAGAGKTWTLNLARRAWQQDGHTVLGVALSRRAASELGEQAQLAYATSIARLLVDLDHEGGLPHRSVLLVDEAAMVGTRTIAALLDHVERADGLLVLIGDDHQVTEIEAGGAFRALAERLPTIELTDNFRQQDPLERDRILALRHGAAETYLDTGMRSGQIVLGHDAQQTRDVLLTDWINDRQLTGPGRTIMLARANTDVQWLNDAARRLLKESGELDGPELTVAGRSFAVGDLVIARRNLPGRTIDNGTRGQIIAVDLANQSVTLRTLDRHQREVTLASGYLHDRHLHHAYALTVNLAQGMTVDRALVLGTSLTRARETLYSALSRHRIAARFYLTAPETLRLDVASIPDPLAPIVKTIGQSAAKRLALDTTPDQSLYDRTPTSELRERRDALRQLVHTYPTKAAQQRDWHAQQLADAEAQLARAHARAKSIDTDLTTAGRQQRPALEHALAREQSTIGAWSQERAKHRHALADLPTQLDPDRWLQRNAPAVRELASIEGTLHRREHAELRTAIAAAMLSPDPQLHAQIGGRPFTHDAAMAWDRAVRTVATYRYHQPAGPSTPHADGLLGPEPTDPQHRARWHEARQALQAQQRTLEHDGPDLTL